MPWMITGISLFINNLCEEFIFDESDNDGSRSGSPGTCTFPFCSGNYIGCVSGVGSGVFVPIGIESIDDVFLLVVFVPR